MSDRRLASGDILSGPEPKLDAGGRLTRNRRTKPCGCWAGEVYRDVPVGRHPDGTFITEKQWTTDAVRCQTHSGAVAVAMYRLQAQLAQKGIQGDGFVIPPQGSLPPDAAQKFLDEHAERIQREVEELDARLKVLRPSTAPKRLPGGDS